MNRRDFLMASSAFAAATTIFGAESGSSSRYRIGYTSNTRGGWEKDPFVGYREAHEVGFNWVEAFAAALDEYYPDKAPDLRKRLNEIGVGVVAITGGRRGGNTHFEDPASRQPVIENHMAVVRFSKKFGADHQKTNMGARRPEGTTDEDLKNMAETLQQLGKRSFGQPTSKRARSGLYHGKHRSKLRRICSRYGSHHGGRHGPAGVGGQIGEPHRRISPERHPARRSRRDQACSRPRSGSDERSILLPARQWRSGFPGPQNASG